MKLAFTICSANYLSFAKSLADSFVKHNPNYSFIIALTDTWKDYDEDFFAPHKVCKVPEMSLPFFDELKERYNIFELSCALKSFVGKHLLDFYVDCNTLFYFDSDILIYSSLSEAEIALQNHSLLITPHLTGDVLFNNASLPTELSMLKIGIYNAGFFGVTRSDESFRFLDWWSNRLKDYCFNNVDRGLFVDQLWLNLAPVFFEKVVVWSHPGYNVAYWNFSERTINYSGNHYLVNRNWPLVLFHYSGYDIQYPDKISKYQPEISLESIPEIATLFNNYWKLVLSNNWADFFSLPITIGKPVPKPVPPNSPRERNFFKRKYKKFFNKL